ncbi:jg24035 [Pararge aegeria aegeria]|uniref:Jg24035 protein n=3 Tax=Pararge aegeria TaxID=116150 RepID=A0A8S4RB72_9NEOP|nr:jg24035 [Pararge aegeria aegeria]
MASKVLVPSAPFAKLQVKKSPPESSGAAGFIIGGDAVARVAHLEHSVRFLQEQHRLMLSGLHAEIEALRERNRDLQFQLIFNKEATVKTAPPVADETVESNEDKLRVEVGRLEKEAGAARGEARAAEARALQLQRLVDAQAE